MDNPVIDQVVPALCETKNVLFAFDATNTWAWKSKKTDNPNTKADKAIPRTFLALLPIKELTTLPKETTPINK